MSIDSSNFFPRSPVPVLTEAAARQRREVEEAKASGAESFYAPASFFERSHEPSPARASDRAPPRAPSSGPSPQMSAVALRAWSATDAASGVRIGDEVQVAGKAVVMRGLGGSTEVAYLQLDAPLVVDGRIARELYLGSGTGAVDGARLALTGRLSQDPDRFGPSLVATAPDYAALGAAASADYGRARLEEQGHRPTGPSPDYAALGAAAAADYGRARLEEEGHRPARTTAGPVRSKKAQRPSSPKLPEGAAALDGRVIEVSAGQPAEVRLPLDPRRVGTWTVTQTDRTLGYPTTSEARDHVLLRWDTVGPMNLAGEHPVTAAYDDGSVGEPTRSIHFTIKVVD